LLVREQVYHTTTFLGGVGVGLYLSWKLTLVTLAFVPLLGLSVLWIKRRGEDHERMLHTSYASAGAAVSEALTCIRTVMAFGSQRREITNYLLKLKPSQVAGVRKHMDGGLGLGLFYLCMFCTYGVGLWFGATLIRRSKLEHPECVENPTLRCVAFVLVHAVVCAQCRLVT
jgi:ATP-binding cassette subfamily B (MDR/TAP) protein 1